MAAFEAALARAAEAEPAGDDELAALREAAGHYAGDLVDGCYDDWLLAERDRYRDRYTWAVRRLAGLLAGRRDHAEAVRLGRELLRIDPLREDTYRLLMRVHDAAGDRAAAVRTYHECVSTLRRELGVGPFGADPGGLRRAHAPGTGRAGGERRRPRRPRGRVALSSPTAGSAPRAAGPTSSLVSGEPGIGKTRLVEDFAAWCGHDGAMVAAARSYPNEGELGYGRRAGVAAGAGVWPATCAGCPTTTGPRWPGSCPSWARPAPTPATPPSSDGGCSSPSPGPSSPRAGRCCSSPTTPSGATVPASSSCTTWCAWSPSPPLLVVATVRREDVDDAHPLRGLVAGLQGIDRVTEIALDRLDRDQTAELARRLAGRSLDPDEAGALHADTEGNPLFIVETLRAGWDLAAISPRLQSVITARLRQVSEPARTLLGLAATVGREFTAGILAAASPVDELSLVRALDELWRRGLVREQGTDAYDFAHGRIRDVVYDALRSGRAAAQPSGDRRRPRRRPHRPRRRRGPPLPPGRPAEGGGDLVPAGGGRSAAAACLRGGGPPARPGPGNRGWP